MLRIDIVIPAFNEADSIAALVSELRRLPLAPAGAVLERIVLVDDGSRDATWHMVSQLHAQEPRVHGVRLSRNFGKEAAIAAGLAVSRADAAVVMDADGQHPPSLIPRLVEEWRRSRCAIVSATKAERQAESLPRRWASVLFYRMFRAATGFDLRGSSDFKLIDRAVVCAYLALPERGKFFRGLTRWLGFEEATVAFAPCERPDAAGSRWSFIGLLRYALSSVTAFSSVPLHLVTWLGVVTLLVAIALGAQTLYKWATGTAVAGFATVILVILFIGSVLMISLGVIGHYVARIYDELKARPPYVIREELAARPSLAQATG